MAAEKNAITKEIESLQKNDPNMQVRINDDLNVVAQIRGNVFGGLTAAESESAELSEDRAKAFVKNNPSLFGTIDADKFSTLQDIAESDGSKNIVFQQYHGKARVYGGSVRFRIKKDTTDDTVNNSLFPDLNDVPKEPKIKTDQAVTAAQKTVGSKGKAENAPELMVYRYNGKPQLVWEVRTIDSSDVRALKSSSKDPMIAGNSDLPNNWIIHVDATTGNVLDYYNNTQTANATTGSGTGYYSGQGSLNVWYNDTTYQMRNTTQAASGGPEIITHDCQGAYPSEDPHNNWHSTTVIPRGACQGPEVDAHKYALKTYAYFRTTHNRNGYDGNGLKAFSTFVHYGTNYDNAGWDGNSAVILGDGSGVAPGFKYFSESTVVGHEYTHAYTQYTCGLAYQNESGALNEAFSDIFGAAFINGTWLVGEGPWLKSTAPALRNMVDPTCGGKWDKSTDTKAIESVNNGWQPSHYSARYTGASDNGGVHINSGIINNLFYLLTVGGTHTVSNQSVSGLGQSACEQMLFRCMKLNLVGKPNATFLDFRAAMLDACLDLFPEETSKLTQVKNAFNAVGIGPEIYMRDNFTDTTGVEPYAGADIYSSPDIISRNAASSNPKADFSNYNNGYAQNLYYGQNNYLYVRLQNKGTSNGNSYIKLYIAPRNSVAAWSSWVYIGALNEVNIPANAKRVSGTLTFSSSKVPVIGQYCLMAVATDPLDPAPNPSLISTATEFNTFVRGTNNIVLKYIDVIAKPA